MLFKKSFTWILAVVMAVTMTVPLTVESFSEPKAVKSGAIQEGTFPDAVYLDASIGSAASNAVEDAIVEGLHDRVSTIDLSRYNVSEDELYNIFFGALNNHPELFYVYSYGASSSNGLVKSISLFYKSEYTEADSQAFSQKTNEILSQVEEGWTDYRKALFLHDYLATHIEYDTELEKYDAYNALVEGSCVCQGYSLAFKHLCNCLDIPCEVIISVGIDHAWNAVCIDGSYYYVDITWDDGASGPQAQCYCAHDLFLLTTKEMHESHESEDWMKGDYSDAYNTMVTGPSRRKGDTAFVYDVFSAILQIGPLMYYFDMDDEGWIYCKYDSETKETKTIYKYNYEDRSDQPVFVYDGKRIYINSSKSIFMIMPEDQIGLLYRLTSAEYKKGEIGNLSIDGNVLTYYVYEVYWDEDSLAATGTCDLDFETIPVKSVTGIDATYTGDFIKPAVEAIDEADNVISSDNYLLDVEETIENVGRHKILVTFMNHYVGPTTTTMIVNPKKTSLKKVKGKKKAFKATWAKRTAQVTGYELEYSLNNDFTNSKTKKITKNTKTSKTISKLKKKKKYYVRIRTYKEKGSVTYYSNWSATKPVKTR
ncbi:MAG: fibronectin type III domain-containing protein [Firmicutes bacterium]|nr:fibronectin type III domain-containing protein [Bacillota bacterium]